MKNNVWYYIMSLDGISEFVLQLNNTININSNRRALIVCFTFNYYFDESLLFYYSAHFVFFVFFNLI